MDWRQIARMTAVGRVLIGAVLVFATRPFGRRWLGEAAEDPATRVVMRAMGARDAVIGLGTLRALEEDQDPRTWVLAAAVTDSVDAGASLLAIRRLGAFRAVGTAIFAGAAAAAGFVAADRLG